MTGNEFLQQLAQHLQCLPDDERANAMAYYQEYLEEAGEEKEEEAVENLGSPQSVAERIIKELGVSVPNGEPKQNKAAQYTVPSMAQATFQSTADAGRIILAIIILVLTSPFWIAVPIVWFTIVLILPIIAVSFFFAGIVAVLQGFYDLFGGMMDLALLDFGVAFMVIGLFMFIWYPCFKGAWELTKLFGRLCRAVFCLLIGKENHK